MSYGPPPTKTPYGDQDFIKEDWGSPQQPPMSTNHGLQDPYQARPLGPYQPGYRAGGNPQHPPGNFGQPHSQPGFNHPLASNHVNPQNLTDTVKSITQDDILFLRSWRQDSFFYRVLPLTTVATGAYYYYNKTKDLPHKPTRYLAIAAACYFFGKLSYRNELRRRLETSPLNTPFMQALRSGMGVQPMMSSGFVSETPSDFTYGSTGGFETGGFNEPKTPAASYDPRGSTSNFGLHNQPGYSMSSENEPTNVDESTTKPSTSYEELRARNRGLLVK